MDVSHQLFLTSFVQSFLSKENAQNSFDNFDATGQKWKDKSPPENDDDQDENSETVLEPD